MNSTLRDYYVQQARGLDHFRGPAYQKGHGLGSFFASLFRSAVPVLKSVIAPTLKRGAKALAKEALSTGTQIATDALSGKDVKYSTKRHSKAAAKRLIDEGARGLRAMIDSPKPKKRRKTIKGRKYQRNTKDIFNG